MSIYKSRREVVDNRAFGRNCISCAAGVMMSTAPIQGAGRGSNPTAALQTFNPKDILIRPIPGVTARKLCQARHYLKSYPGGSLLNFGIFVGSRLLGVAVFGVGPTNIHCLFKGASPDQVICLSRFWLDDRLGRNCESHVLAVILRKLRKHQSLVKALVAYSDPAAGHTGIIYRAAGFLYLGLSVATPRYLLSDGKAHHSRTMGQVFGTHSVAYLRRHGLAIKLVPQAPKLTYVALIDPTWRQRLKRSVIQYAAKEVQQSDENC